jgi:hypothetical protein
VLRAMGTAQRDYLLDRQVARASVAQDQARHYCVLQLQQRLGVHVG